LQIAGLANVSASRQPVRPEKWAADQKIKISRIVKRNIDNY
jgi:hypothetical protein